MMFLAPLLLAAAMSPSSSATAGSQLYLACKASIRMFDGTSLPGDAGVGRYCLGYAAGFSSGSSLSSGLVCFSEGTRLGTIIRVYVAYVDKNPELMDEDMDAGFLAAERNTYSCPAKQ